MIGKPFAFVFLAYLLLWSFFVGSALMSACGVAFHALVPIFDDAVNAKIVFGLLASAVGGIQEQIEDGVSGILLKDPTDVEEFSRGLSRLLGDASYARRLGEAARERVRERYLGVRHLLEYARLIEELDR